MKREKPHTVDYISLQCHYEDAKIDFFLLNKYWLVVNFQILKVPKILQIVPLKVIREVTRKRSLI